MLNLDWPTGLWVNWFFRSVYLSSFQLSWLYFQTCTRIFTLVALCLWLLRPPDSRLIWATLNAENLWLTSRNTRNGFSSPLHVGLGYMHLASWSLKLSGTWVLGCLFALILLTELDEDQFYLAHLWPAFQSCFNWPSPISVPKRKLPISQPQLLLQKIQ